MSDQPQAMPPEQIGIYVDDVSGRREVLLGDEIRDDDARYIRADIAHQTGDRINDLKLQYVIDRGYKITGHVLAHATQGKAIVDMAAVRWFDKHDDFFLMMHADQGLRDMRIKALEDALRDAADEIEQLVSIGGANDYIAAHDFSDQPKHYRRIANKPNKLERPK